MTTRETTMDTCHCGYEFRGCDHCDFCFCEQFEAYCEMTYVAEHTTEGYAFDYYGFTDEYRENEYTTVVAHHSWTVTRERDGRTLTVVTDEYSEVEAVGAFEAKAATLDRWSEQDRAAAVAA